MVRWWWGGGFHRFYSPLVLVRPAESVESEHRNDSIKLMFVTLMPIFVTARGNASRA